MKPVIIGAGLSGLTAALTLAPEPVILISADKLGEGCSSAWAQGGIAAAIGADDSRKSHADDTCRAGLGLCDRATVERVTGDGARVIDTLISHGILFDRDTNGNIKLGLEGAHSGRRIVHANGDATGRVIMNTLTAAVRRTPSIQVLENTLANDLIVGDGIAGVCLRRRLSANTTTENIATDRVILATGGCGGLWEHTTNPPGNCGYGLALAARAGAVLSDLEFMQFHPTAISVGQDPMPLASEALRGEGAILVDEQGCALMADYPRRDLEARDVVARAIWSHMSAGHKIFLDARSLGVNFATRFPTINGACSAAGINPMTMPIPVSPAAHYHMGGIKTDAKGRTSIKGLWACGEVASTGLHGANRLASNSLLEAAAFGRYAAADVGEMPCGENHLSDRRSYFVQAPRQGNDDMIRHIMTAHVGVLREKAGLERALHQLETRAVTSDPALAAWMITSMALRRMESRGAHTRTDFPETSPAWNHRQDATLKDLRRDLGARKLTANGV